MHNRDLRRENHGPKVSQGKTAANSTRFRVVRLYGKLHFLHGKLETVGLFFPQILGQQIHRIQGQVQHLSLAFEDNLRNAEFLKQEI